MKPLISVIFIFILFSCSENAQYIVENKDIEKKTEHFDIVYFENGSHELSVKAKDVLMKFARLSDISQKTIYLSGHTDKSGAEAANNTLSKTRVDAVKDFLIQLGMKEENIKSEFFGEKKPIQKGDSQQDYAKNRRVEIYLIQNIGGGNEEH
ncbi:MAG: OmpA family protein [Elusimicrobiota bacterium]|jgi:peptidoglycan-associated lipoprotein|nr:OmpA family protein [Elusimicrobiota bacterium]